MARKQNTAGVLELVERGEIVEITNRGKAIARIVPSRSRERTRMSWSRPCATGNAGDAVSTRRPRTCGRRARSAAGSAPRSARRVRSLTGE
ncbi:type II toxin-antitoxin system prevent-host-death family antitoxin [Lentzea tibetensis]|uniref:Type II toxin-antitoxin system prevent-host-death family antitoxin n=1 Tax=Lentzea tibetensis TaxID=2591470 RepID=A0A563EN28_9PSEU|nr:type II toxin-antitoxin system prevent-host-death family antitoxin [Lentzea tibetensis]TWP48728.1 type II toxin-antitoxin system prevent-host-death family antitoxin [Lentzea tibetensis]